MISNPSEVVYNEYMEKFYITSAIPYVNAQPHIGWATEIIQADVIQRYQRVLGKDVYYLCGSDENSLKNVQAAEKEGLPIQEFVDKYSAYFTTLAKNLNIQFDAFQRGSNPTHHTASQKLWKLCQENDDIYKKQYTGLYCVGCELFYTPDELNEKGECFEHPGKKLEEVTEENYFFRLSKYKEQLIQLISSNQLAIVPEFRKNEVLSFLKGNLEDISISRSNERAKNWGVSVPDDPTQKLYVWFDALNIYQSGVGFGSDEEKYKKWWPADLHVIGKGILRFHAIYWPAFLLSAKLKLPKKLFVHEYLTINGQKISKSLGNAIDPNIFIEKYGADAVRYYCLAKISPFSDGDFSDEKFADTYNADLANGLGNLVARIAKLCELAQHKQADGNTKPTIDDSEYKKALDEYRFPDACNVIWEKITKADKYIDETKPWELIKQNDPKVQTVLSNLVDQVQQIAILLQPLLPETAKKITEQFNQPEIKAAQSLFPRIEK